MMGAEPAGSASVIGAWGWSWERAWPRLILGSIVAVAIATLVPLPPVVRSSVVVWFCLFCTGMAWVRLLRLRSRLAEVVAALALSFAISGLVAAAFLYAGRWSPAGTMTTLQCLTACAVLVDLTLQQRA
jgi:hypothetical protein